MPRNDASEGPRVGQVVLYNNSGTKIVGIINQVNSTGTVNLATVGAGSGTWTDRGTVGYSPNADTTSTWGYAEFF